jgi:glycerol-3-phosphate acyltransferase PlsY
MNLAGAMLVAYLAGAIPFAALVARLKNVDLRAHGSGNLGATNAIRVLGLGFGIPVLLLDIGKGWACVAAVPALFGLDASVDALACGGAAVIGHVGSVFVRFRGGKGVATAAGVFLGLAPAATGLAFLVFVAALLGTRFVSVASMSAAVALAVALWVLDAPPELFLAGVAVAVLVLLRHRTNLARLRAGTENRLTLRRRESREGGAS